MTADHESGADDDIKQKFREALKAKHGRKGEDHTQGDSPQVQPHGPVDAKRVYRRKTG